MTEPADAAPLLARLGSALYEALLLAALIFVTGFLMLPLISPGRAATATELTLPPVPSRVALFCTLFAMMALYFVWSWSGGRRTLPMKTWRLHIATAEGGPLAGKTALLRYLAAWIGPALALIGYALLRDLGHGGWALWLLALNFLWALADPDRQFLHDRIAGTRILRDA